MVVVSLVGVRFRSACRLAKDALTASGGSSGTDEPPDEVQHVVVGQVLQGGQGQVPSRQVQVKAGIPREVSSETVNKVCASSLRAVGMADQYIRAGDISGPVVTGGMESMSK